MATRKSDLFWTATTRLLWEPAERRVRVYADGDLVADTRGPLLVWEPARVVPGYAVPRADLEAEVGPGRPVKVAEDPRLLHPGIPFSVHSTPGSSVTVAGREDAGFVPDDPDLRDYVVLDFDAFTWVEEDEPIRGHPRDPFHRVEVRQSSRPVRLSVDGTVVAESRRPVLLFETGLPTRFYLPREDVRVPLRPRPTRTYCPYKGEASYWSFDTEQIKKPLFGFLEQQGWQRKKGFFGKLFD